MIFKIQFYRYFAWLMKVLTKDKDFKYEEIKKEHFKSLHDIVSQDPTLRQEKSIKILEVGVGTGKKINIFFIYYYYHLRFPI